MNSDITICYKGAISSVRKIKTTNIEVMIEYS